MTSLLVILSLFTQVDTLDLAAAHRQAEATHPRGIELHLEERMSLLRDQNLRTRYLPSVALSGQAMYQSDVPAVPAIPGASPSGIPHDQYKVSAALQQVVYDAGVTAAERRLEEIAGALAVQQTVADLFAVRMQVNELFFGMLGIESRLAVLELSADDLTARIDRARVQVREGALLASNLDILLVERLRIDLEMAEIRGTRRATLHALGVMIGRSLPEDIHLVRHDPPRLPPIAENTRPERVLFELQRDHLAAASELTRRRGIPSINGFAEAAYGRPPGTNFFDDRFQPFYSAGVRMAWSPWTWGSRRRERDILDLRRESVAAREAEFDRTIAIQAQAVQEEIERLEEMLVLDEEIVVLRRRIRAEAAVRLDAGAITAADYITERNAALRAELQREQHRVELAHARARYLTLLGHDIR